MWSADCETIAFTRTRDDAGGLFTMSSGGSGQTRLTAEDGYAFAPDWSPNGAKVAFSLLVDPEVAVIASDGTGLAQVTDSEGEEGSFDW